MEMMMDSQSERGAAAVEFALVLPLLLLLVLGIADLGRAYSVQTTLSSAAREGVRVMALQNNATAARSAAKSAATNLALSDAQISVTPTSCAVSSSTPTATATVTISYPFAFVAGGYLHSGITIKGQGVMRCNG
jgi:Flp pilus assembly protein TadG